MEFLDLLQLGLVLASAIFTLSFVVTYFTMSRWRASVVGRALLLQATSWASLLFIGLFAFVQGESLIWNDVSLSVVLALIASSSGYMLYALIHSLRNPPEKGISDS